jgi:hypothetical protein
MAKHAPAVASVIERMFDDDRFQSNDEKRWSLAKEEAPEERERLKKRPGAGTSMVNPETDNMRMAKWRQELGPDKKPYQDDE